MDCKCIYFCRDDSLPITVTSKPFTDKSMFTTEKTALVQCDWKIDESHVEPQHNNNHATAGECSVLYYSSRDGGFGPHWHHCVVSLSKTHLSLLSTDSNQKEQSQHNWEIVDWDVKNQIKQSWFTLLHSATPKLYRILAFSECKM